MAKKSYDPFFLLLSPHVLKQVLEEVATYSFPPRLELLGLTSMLTPFPSPIPKHLHTPGSNGRYSTVQCRISHSSLTSLLRDWSSFVLVEGYSYVKLLSRWAK